MSVLETPRIYFKGQVSWDPVTTNNYANNYDEKNCSTVLPTLLSTLQDDVQGFRDGAIIQIADGTGNWNPHGTYRSSFYDTAVCGVDRGKGTSTDDPFSTSAVNFTGMLVDLEPYGSYSSQLFFDSMLFGVQGGYCIQLPRTSRVTARQINFGRNSPKRLAIAGIASVIWTTSFAKANGLRVDAFDSDILTDLSEALKDEDVLGLTVRFNAYRTVYYDNPTLTNGSAAMQEEANKLQAKIVNGGFQPNPARSLIVGVLGLWRKGEPAHEPGDRALVPVGAPPPVAGVSARCDDHSLVIDFSNSVPEVDTALEKVDLGPLSVVAIDASGAVQEDLGSIPYKDYNRAAYEASAGIVTLPLSAGISQKLAGLKLQLSAKGATILSEQVLRAIPLEPNKYMDQDFPGEASFQVYERGFPAGAGVGLTMNQMKFDGSVFQAGMSMTTDAAGVVTVPLPAKITGITAYVPSFTPAEAPAAPNGLSTQINTYMYVRVLPADKEIAALPPTWPNVYAYVLANWNAMAPCMDNWLRLDDPSQIRAYTAILKRLTAQASLEHFRYMPITRDLSAGMRSLLYAWLDSPADAAAELPSRVQLFKKGLRTHEFMASEEKQAVPLESMTQTELSRSMRGVPKGSR
jgi:hypothetical protein